MIEINKKTYCSTLEEAIEKKASYKHLSKRLKNKVDVLYGTTTKPLCEYHFLLLKEVYGTNSY